MNQRLFRDWLLAHPTHARRYQEAKHLAAEIQLLIPDAGPIASSARPAVPDRSPWSCGSLAQTHATVQGPVRSSLGVSQEPRHHVEDGQAWNAHTHGAQIRSLS